MQAPDLLTMRLFVTVCETGSMAAAAEIGNIVSSAVSKRLAHLEYAAGTPLFSRRSRGVVPTAAGQTMLEHARAMLAQAAQLQRDMDAYAAGARGNVRMLAPSTAMATWLPGDVAAFLRQPHHANIRVDMIELDSPRVLSGLLDGSASLGVCWDAMGLGALQAVPYRVDHLFVAVPPRHPLARRKTLRFEQTLAFEQFSMPANAWLQVILLREAARLGRVVASSIVISSLEAALRAVHAGLAIGVVPGQVAQATARASGLRLIPLDEPWARRQFMVCFRDRRALSPAAQALVEHLRIGVSNSPARPDDQTATHQDGISEAAGSW